jgi:hypothetical protein
MLGGGLRLIDDRGGRALRRERARGESAAVVGEAGAAAGRAARHYDRCGARWQRTSFPHVLTRRALFRPLSAHAHVVGAGSARGRPITATARRMGVAARGAARTSATARTVGRRAGRCARTRSACVLGLRGRRKTWLYAHGMSRCGGARAPMSCPGGRPSSTARARASLLRRAGKERATPPPARSAGTTARPGRASRPHGAPPRGARPPRSGPRR